MTSKAKRVKEAGMGSPLPPLDTIKVNVDVAVREHLAALAAIMRNIRGECVEASVEKLGSWTPWRETRRHLRLGSCKPQ